MGIIYLDEEGKEFFSGTYEMNSNGFSEFLKVLCSHGEKLDKMIEFDNGLLDSAEKLVAEADVFKNELTKHKLEKTRIHLDNLESTLEELEETFDGRDEVVKGVR
jgi:hypothetical protein